MTTQTAIEQFKQNPDIVPDELSNKLVEDCLEVLTDDEQARRIKYTL